MYTGGIVMGKVEFPVLMEWTHGTSKGLVVEFTKEHTGTVVVGTAHHPVGEYSSVWLVCTNRGWRPLHRQIPELLMIERLKRWHQ